MMDKSVEESIIVPMNPHGSYSGGSTPGSIIAQKWFADRKGKVIISFDKGCKYIDSLEKPHLGFFYNSDKGEVTHRFSIIDVTDDRGISKYVTDFLPPWRQELYETKPEPGKHRTWIVICDIYELNEPKTLDYFGKKNCRSYVYSFKGSELTYSEKSPSPEDFIDEIIYRRARASDDKFTEDDLELIIWALMIKNNAEYIQRQRRYESDGKNLRLDLLTKTSKGEYVVMELKRDTATKETLVNQLRPYMMRVMDDFGLAKLKGCIVARDASSDLKKELSKTENDDIEFVSYMFSFKLKENKENLF